MERQAFLRKLEEVLEVPSKSLLESTSLDSVENWNSLGIIGYIALVDEEFRRELDPDAIEGCRTIGQLIDLAVA